MPPKARGGRGARASQRGRGSRATPAELQGVPTEYQDLLQEALQNQAPSPDRPRKKRRTGLRGEIGIAESNHAGSSTAVHKTSPVTSNKQQVVYLSDDDDSELAFEDVHLGGGSEDEDEDENGYDDGRLDIGEHMNDDSEEEPLDLTLRAKPKAPAAAPKRKGTTKEDRGLRLQTHKMHLLCLLAHLDRRNAWCNNRRVQRTLRPLLPEKTVNLLKPKASLAQFGKSESIRKGLYDACVMWANEFKITHRGLRKPQWLEERLLGEFKIPDLEPPMDRSDFIEAAKKLEGSRDTGAQLFCALMRSQGLSARLVCSLQPLAFTGKAAQSQTDLPLGATPRRTETPDQFSDAEAINIYSRNSGLGSSSSMPMTARRRLGHPGAADYHLPTPPISTPRAVPKPKKKIRESPYPIYWVEVLDSAYQKWIPVDPLVTNSVGKPRMFEPPAADNENNMTYVVAFDEEGTARDVTRRYAKAYNAKTRKLRVESTTGGQKWWDKVMARYYRGWKTDIEQVEDTELAAAEAREPMPKNVIDFKDHPVYALERHLRKNEVLVNRHSVGRVSAGKSVEVVYRRSDVKTARSADRWYRMGREVKEGEQPVRISPPKDEEEAGVGLYTEDQTILYECPPVVNGRVPKNSYGNLDLYVPSMLPRGGVHIPHPDAARAARLLGINYADAVTGFEFRGRRGTAVLNGIVCASEFGEAVDAVIQGFYDQNVREMEERRTTAALIAWKRFLIALRIKQRIDTYDIEGENKEQGDQADAEVEAELSDHGYEKTVDDAAYDYEAQEGGGFLLE